MNFFCQFSGHKSHFMNWAGETGAGQIGNKVLGTRIGDYFEPLTEGIDEVAENLGNLNEVLKF